MTRAHDYEATRRSWNVATRNHNAHKGDQAAFLRDGGDVLFLEELALLGDVRGKRLVHLQCNAGQDSLCLARRGADVTGVDLSDEAVTFARKLSGDSGIPARFIQSEVVQWLRETDERFDLAFASYGVIGWLPELRGWAEGVARILRPGGRFVLMEFHPLVWSIGEDLRPSRDDYFADHPFVEPVGDYVGESAGALGAVKAAAPEPNPFAAFGWQHTLASVVDAIVQVGLRLETIQEFPFSNGCRVHPALELAEDRRWRWPKGIARLPLMFGLSARREA